MQDLGLWALGALTVGTALLSVTVKNLVHALLWLGVSLTGTAALFALFGASFLAGMQVLLYVGGIVMLLIFGVMLTQKHDTIGALRQTRRPLRAALVAVAVFAALVQAILSTPGLDAPASTDVIGIESLGESLLGPYGLAFELLSLLLLGAMVGAVVLARKRDPGEPSAGILPRRRQLGRQVVEGLAKPPASAPHPEVAP